MQCDVTTWIRVMLQCHKMTNIIIEGLQPRERYESKWFLGFLVSHYFDIWATFQYWVCFPGPSPVLKTKSRFVKIQNSSLTFNNQIWIKHRKYSFKTLSITRNTFQQPVRSRLAQDIACHITTSGLALFLISRPGWSFSNQKMGYLTIYQEPGSKFGLSQEGSIAKYPNFWVEKD